MSLEPCTPEIPTLVLGEDKTLDVKMINLSSPSRDPLDLTDATEIVAILLNADGTFLELKLSLSQITIISAPGGHFQIAITAAQSALLAQSAPGGFTDIEVQFIISSKKTITTLTDAVSIIPRRYPTAP